MVHAAASLWGRGLPEAPPPELWPVLDAAKRCFARHGLRRTSVPDIARELGVERTTVYRRADTVDHIARLVLARELHHLIDELPRQVTPGTDGPALIVDLLAGAVEFAWADPVLAKVLADEPEALGDFLAEAVPELVERVTAVVSPLLAAAMGAGLLAPRRPEVIAEWLVRVGLSLLIAPPPADVREFLAEMVRPALAPPPPTS